MFRYLIIAAAGIAVVTFYACSPGEVTNAAVSATDTAAEKAAAVVDDAKAVAKPTIEAAKEAARNNDRLSRAQPPVSGAKAQMAAAATAVQSDVDTKSIIAAGDKNFRAGKDYVVLSPAKRTSSPPEKVELTEVFMYQCPHCFSFEPFIEKVTQGQPAQMNFVRMPAIFNSVAELHAKAFYASQALGNWEDLHVPLFQEIHTRRNLMPTEDKLLDFIAKQGIDRDAFGNAMKSFEVDSKVRDAKSLNAAYQIGSVPTLVVNGKYVTDGKMAGSTQKLDAIVRYLVAKEAAAL
ncbi:MAG: thiol:disulfide interchange protein DsbA/DsbL [Gammaproteobacteria bacterium]